MLDYLNTWAGSQQEYLAETQVKSYRKNTESSLVIHGKVDKEVESKSLTLLAKGWVRELHWAGGAWS